MKRTTTLIAAITLLWGIIPSNVFANVYLDDGISVVNNDKLELDIYGREQMLGVLENIPDPIADHQRVYLFMKESRLGFKGQYMNAYKYDIELAYGGEDANGSNTDLTLLNFSADVPVTPLGENTVVKIGQMRVPYSREGLGDEGYQDFADRSIANLASYQGRDYGLALMSTVKDVWTGTIGTFSSGGKDVPQRYLPENLGIPEVVARFGYNDGVDNDIYHVMGTDLNLKRTTMAAYLNALYTLDTRIGHSTALLSKDAQDENLLVDSDYNPYINRGNNGEIGSATTLDRGSYYTMGGDAVIRHPLDNTHAVEAETEANWGGYQNAFGVIHIASARAQADYQFGPFEAGLRYAILSMGNNAGLITAAAGANATYSTAIPGTSLAQYNMHMGEPIHEITPSLTWHIMGESLKVVMDLPIYLDCPLFIDHTDGAYAFPDQTSTYEDTVVETAGDQTVRRNFEEARMEFQFQF